MQIKINKNKHEIPTADNLTCRQYLDCLNVNENDPFLLHYLSIVTGISYIEVANSSIDFRTMARITKYVGQIKHFDYFLNNQSAQILIKGNLFVSTRKDFDVEKTGVHELFKAKAATTENQAELSIYLLAILLTPDFDAKTVQERYEQLLEENYIKILSFSAFFLRKLLAYFMSYKPSWKVLIRQRIKNILRK